MGFILQDRDIQILQQITKYRFLLSRQIKVLCNFSGQRACDRRTKKLIDNGLLEKKHFLYGIPSLYFTTEKAKTLHGLAYITKNVRIENINHDVLVIDSAIYLAGVKGIPEKDIVSERQIKNQFGFGKSRHVPDLLYDFNDKKCCVEIELNVKQYSKLYKNVKENYDAYDYQIWFIDFSKEKLVENLNKLRIRYSSIITIDIGEVMAYVKSIQA